MGKRNIVGLIAAIGAVVLGGTLQQISMPLWLNSYQQYGQNVGAYFIFLFSSLVYVIFFLFFLLIAPLIRKILLCGRKQPNSSESATTTTITNTNNATPNQDGSEQQQQRSINDEATPPESPSTPLIPPLQTSTTPGSMGLHPDEQAYLKNPNLFSFVKSVMVNKRMMFNCLFLFASIGFFDAINGILSVYSSPPTRTPPLLQTFFSNLGFIFGIVLTPLTLFLYFRSKRAFIPKTLSSIPVLGFAAVLITGGIVVSMLPQIFAVAKGQVPFFQLSAKDGMIWSVVFIIGLMPGIEYNILQKVFLDMREKKQAEKDPKSKFDQWFESLIVLFFGCLFQLITALLFWFVDIIPGFGSSSSVSDFLSTTWSSAKCNFNPVMCPLTGMYCALFNIGYTIGYIGSVYLNKDSPVFGMIASLIGSPLATLFWILVEPQFAPPGTTWWSMTFSIVPLYLGIILWKGWEIFVTIGDERRKNKDIMEKRSA